MDRDTGKSRKEILLENLAVASVLALVALIIASVAFVLDAGEVEAERGAISALASGGQAVAGGQDVAARPLASGDEAFRRVFPIGSGRQGYGAVISLGSLRSSARVAVILSPRGELLGASCLETASPGLPYAREGWFRDFLGKGGDKPYLEARADSRDQSYLETARALGRLSAFVRSRGGEE